MTLINTLSVFWTCYISLVFYMVVISFFTATFDFFKGQKILGPKPIIVFGNWWRIWRHKIHELDYERYKRYGRIFGIFDGRTPNAFVGEPKLIRKMLVENFERFSNRRNLSFSSEKYINYNLMGLKDGNWKNAKLALSKIFTGENKREMELLMNESILTLIASLPEFASQKEINLKTALIPFINTSIDFCGFGMNCNTKGRFQSAFPKIFAPKNCPKTFLTLQVLYPRIGKLFQFFFSKKYELEGISHLADTAKMIIREHKSGNHTMKRKSGSLIDLILRESDSKSDEASSLQDEDAIIGHTLHLLLTGFEINYIIICLTLHCLAMNHQIQKKLRDAISEAMKKHKSICHELVQDLPYLEQCILEVLRMYPPITRAERVCKDRIAFKGVIRFNPGCVVTVPIFALHRDEEFYPDPNKYDPERFSESNKATRKPFTFLPFGIDPRSCTGMEFAMEFTKLTICHLLSNYRFFPVHATIDPPEFSPGSMGLLSLEKLHIGIEKLVN